MHVIYLDVLFAINLAINFVLLLLTGEFSGIYARRLRIFFGAGAGALFAVLMFFCDFSGVSAITAKVIFCVAVTIIAFGKEANGHLLKLCMIFCAVNFALAGIVMALSYIGGGQGLISVKNGVPYIDISIKLLLLSTAVAYGVLTLIFGGGAVKIGKRTNKLQINLGKRCLTLKAFSDTGNMLRDPISGKLIIVVGKREAVQLFEFETREIINNLTDGNIIGCYEKLSQFSGHRFGVIPYKNSSTASGLLLTVKADSITVDGSPSGKYLLGISPVEIEIADGCRAVMGV